MINYDEFGIPIKEISPEGFYVTIIVGGEVSELGPYPSREDAKGVADSFFPRGSKYDLAEKRYRNDVLEGRVLERLPVAA
jgi:hypothetical protein